MSIFLLILKIVGLFILALIGLIILLALCILFAPISYKSKGYSNEADTYLSFKAGWLFNILYFRLVYTGQTIDFVFRIFGIPYRDNDDSDGHKKKKKKKKNRKKDKKNKDNTKKDKLRKDSDDSYISDNEILENTISDEKIIDSKEKDRFKNESKNNNSSEFFEDNSYLKNSSDTVSYADDSIEEDLNEDHLNEDDSYYRMLYNFVKNLVHGFFEKVSLRHLRINLNPVSMIKSVFSRIKSLAGNFDETRGRFLSLIRDKKNKKAVAHLKREFIVLLKVLAPKKGKVNARFSLKDPDKTGLLVGGLAIFPIFLRKGVHIIPDFNADRYYFNGNFYFKGRVKLIKILFIIIRIARDRYVKRLWTQVNVMEDK